MFGEASMDALDSFCGECDRVDVDDCITCEKEYAQEVKKLKARVIHLELLLERALSIGGFALERILTEDVKRGTG